MVRGDGGGLRWRSESWDGRRKVWVRKGGVQKSGQTGTVGEADDVKLLAV